MEISSQKIKAVNGQPILTTKGTNSAKEKLAANTSKKKKKGKKFLKKQIITCDDRRELFDYI
jgi:hypothetical protein